MRDFGLLNKDKHSWYTELKPALIFLSHFNIIQKTESTWSKDGNGILIFPSILSIITNQGINDMIAEIDDLKEGSDDLEQEDDQEDEA